MDDRYSRQTSIPEIGKEGQKILKKSTVAIVGCGGLGTNVAEVLTRAGVGTLLLVEDDRVELSNLQRQTLYEEADIGKPKADALALHLRGIDSDAGFILVKERMTEETLGLLDGAELVLDCTDNLETRFLLNGYALEREKKTVFCSAQGLKGMVYVVDPSKEWRACLACLLGGRKPSKTPAETGVLGAAVRMAASLQATEALKILLGQPCTEGLVSFDVWTPRLDVVKTTKRPGCAACGKK